MGMGGVKLVHERRQQDAGNPNHPLGCMHSDNQNAEHVGLSARCVRSKCRLSLVTSNCQNASAPRCIDLATQYLQEPAPDVLEEADLTSRKFPTEHQ